MTKMIPQPRIRFDGETSESEDGSEIFRVNESACQICPIGADNNIKRSPFQMTFFAEQRDLVPEIFSFLDPPSMYKFCRGIPTVRPFLTHDYVIRSVARTLQTETFNQDNQCYRRKRHQYRHIQYHKIVVEKMIPSLRRQASTRQTPMQLLRAVSGRYCERCQLNLICVTGW